VSVKLDIFDSVKKVFEFLWIFNGWSNSSFSFTPLSSPSPIGNAGKVILAKIDKQKVEGEMRMRMRERNRKR
jgi:hypothetical protein